MSLLLDALKKAAKDKEAVSAANSAKHSSATDYVVSGADINDESGFEFELDENLANESGPANQGSSGEPPAENLSLDDNDGDQVRNTISDEALQVLIYKTNREYKRRHRIIWSTAIVVSVTVLIVSGLYFFNEMQESVDALERRHAANMRRLQTEPVKVTSSKQVMNNVHDESEAHVATPGLAVTKSDDEKKSHGTAGRENAHMPMMTSQNAGKQIDKNRISIERGEKRDPVGDLLNTAWVEYNAADYRQAEKLYKQVLQKEKNNRDALMGLGAVALKIGDGGTARQYYTRLLQIDPRDAIANAAILNLDISSADSMSENKLQFLLRQNPTAAHLHYALGNKYAAQDRWPEAQNAYFNAFDNDSTNADYAYNLAISLEHIGRPVEAIRFYQNALSLAQNSNISFSTDAVRKRLGQIQQ